MAQVILCYGNAQNFPPNFLFVHSIRSFSNFIEVEQYYYGCVVRLRACISSADFLIWPPIWVPELARLESTVSIMHSRQIAIIKI
jgi:hypothetical protein